MPATNGLKRAVFQLPGQADPDTLTTRISGNGRTVIEDIAWRQTASQDEAAVKALRKKMDLLKEERIRMQSTLKSLDVQVQFWQMQTKAKFKTLADALNMAGALGRNMKKAMAEKLALEPELEKLEKRIRALQEELNAAAGKKETTWEVTALLSGARGNDTTLTYTYELQGCGWTPLYRLEAQPLKKQVLFSWEGEIWQSSGQDWNHVAVHLANMQPKLTLTPPDMPPWVVQPKAQRVYKKAARSAPRMAELQEMAKSAAPFEDNAAAPPAPVLMSEGTYTSWDLGVRNIPAGEKQKVKVLEESWPAEFTHLSRPSLSEQVFLRAVARFSEAREIPKGNAVYLIDGAIIGKRTFSAGTNEETVFFGADPMVKARATLLTQKSGEKTFLKDRQTHAWDWRIDLENNRKYAVKMRIEEPIAQSRDERIKVTTLNVPEPGEKNETFYIWTIDVPAGAKYAIKTGITVEAPKEMPLDLGWRH